MGAKAVHLHEMPRGKLPGVERDQPEQIVLHVDMDCFYAACERVRRPEIRDRPVIVGMGYEPDTDSGVVATASYEARERGVEAAQSIAEALEHLPRDDDGEMGGVYLPVDMEHYETISDEVMELLDQRSDALRVESIDEAYLDVTSMVEWEGVEQFVANLQSDIVKEVGVPASIGAAPAMSVAKIASDYDKPEGVTIVPPDSVEGFLYPLDVSLLHGVGPVTQRELSEMGIETVADLAETPPSSLKTRFGERGEQLYRHASGLDDRTVREREDPKSFSREAAFKDDAVEHETKRATVADLAEDVAARLRQKGAAYQTVTLKIVRPPYDVNTVSRSFAGPIDGGNLLREAAVELFDSVDVGAMRKIGVKASRLTFEDGEQATLGGWEETISAFDASIPAIPREEAADAGTQATLGDFDLDEKDEGEHSS